MCGIGTKLGCNLQALCNTYAVPGLVLLHLRRLVEGELDLPVVDMQGGSVVGSPRSAATLPELVDD